MNDEPAASSPPARYPYQQGVRKAIDRAPYTVIRISTGATVGALIRGPAEAFLGAVLIGLLGLSLDLAARKDKPEVDTTT